jgi:DegV family protein with EDD domain
MLGFNIDNNQIMAVEGNMIGIITDSTCDIPEHLVDQYGITIVPQYIIWGNEQFKDRIELKPLEFYQRLLVDETKPTTSQASVVDFKNVYDKVFQQGAQELIVLTVSSAMSGTYQMAKEAAKLVNFPVSVVDSKGPTMTLGWQVLAAARARDVGADVKSILETIDNVRKRMVQFVAMDTLEYLQKGGRIGGAVKWVGGLLQVKPLVSINHETGLVEPVTLARTHKALIENMYKKFFEKLDIEKKLHIAVLHGNALEKAEELAARIQSDYNPVELLINMTGPVLGINTGPGALALCGYSEE